MFSWGKKNEPSSADILAERLKKLKFSTNLPEDLVEDIKKTIADKISAYYRIKGEDISFKRSELDENQFEVSFTVENKS